VTLNGCVTNEKPSTKDDRIAQPPPNPNGIQSFSPGLIAQQSTLGKRKTDYPNPVRVESFVDDAALIQPFQGWETIVGQFPRVDRNRDQPWAE
jgi:hypothetical protein